MTTPPRILVLGFHIVWDRASAGDGGWASVYRAELEKVAPGCRVDFRSVVAGNGGVAYEAWAAAQLRGPKALGSLAACIERDYVADKGYDLVVLTAWSAGYAAIRALLAEARRARHVPSWLDVVACLDAGYATTGADGRPVPAHVEPWSFIAEAAIAGGVAFVFGASDVPTHPGGPETLPTAPGYSAMGGYESSSELAVAIADLVPALAFTTYQHALPYPSEWRAGSCVLRLYDGVPGDRGTAEHVAAVHGWGPALLAEGVRLRLLDIAQAQAADTEPAPATEEAPVPSAPPVVLTDVVLVREGDRGARVQHVQAIVGATRTGVWDALTTRRVGVWLAAFGLPVVPWWSSAAQSVAESRGAPKLPPPAPGARPRGIDVSRAQGDGRQNAWDRWDVSFGFGRSSSGVTVDPTFAGNVERMRGANLVLDASYHYGNGRAPATQLDAIVEAHNRAGVELKGRAIAVDLEPWGTAAAPSSITSDWVYSMGSGIPEQLVTMLKAVGANVGIYSAGWALDVPTLVGLAARLHALGVWWWIADASAEALAAGHPVAGLPRGIPLEAVRFWQRGRRGAFGEPLPVDDDEFLGTVEELRVFARG